MSDIEVEFSPLPNIGICMAQIPEVHLIEIKNEINDIQNNFESHKSQQLNAMLAGNIAKEYKLEKSISSLERLILPLFQAYANNNNLHRWNRTLSHDVKIKLGTCWVNFMEKHEFNPVHNHSGIASFVIWIKIPYFIKDEQNHVSSRYSNLSVPGMFQFLYQNISGYQMTYEIPADKEYENVICMFPSSLMHNVYPFATSDGYRISVSGNVFYDTYDSRLNRDDPREI